MKKNKNTIVPDFVAENLGSLFIIRTETAAARNWKSDYVNLESYMDLGTTGFYCEARYVEDIVLGMKADGLVCGNE
jgi:hypothetical protein